MTNSLYLPRIIAQGFVHVSASADSAVMATQFRATKAPALLLKRALVPAVIRPSFRSVATEQSPKASSPRRKQVTVVNDNGSVKWVELSAGEKAARATQQTFNFGIIVLGIVMGVSIPFDHIVLIYTGWCVIFSVHGGFCFW